MQNKTEVPAKRDDPNYMQIAGDVKKQTGLRFKAICTLKQISVGEGLEQAMTMWLNAQDEFPPSTTSKAKKGGGVSD
ncbi:MAG: hypothetical protein F6J86_16880 [Symploca sp. SIO1B1]|nr:hypothetical protein [Symploca sp. SIO2C1]NEQ64801.1 hypothetical protein [Symploca sp. SIO2D2]NER95487.1 hypothetical protein [Symploca sp. SIO1B1]NES25523.1 hypothetical protein [Caldora sp. SIO3E6]